jgi:S1-C subfamily serine protease
VIRPTLFIAIIAASLAVGFMVPMAVDGPFLRDRPTPTWGIADQVEAVVLVEVGDFGHGSGAIIGPDRVLTARHVSDAAEQRGVVMRVRTQSGAIYEVREVLLDIDDDLAVLVIEGWFHVKPLVIDPTPLAVGDRVWIVGTPMERGLFNCVLPGHVVKLGWDIAELDNLGLVVIDAHDAPGCSGGPVLDAQGRIRAVVTVGGYGLVGCVPVGRLDDACL